MMSSPVLAYGKGQAPHITTNSWFCRRTKASLNGVIREFENLSKLNLLAHLHDLRNKRSPELTRELVNTTRAFILDIKEHFPIAAAPIKASLNTRISDLTRKIKTNKSSLLGRISNIFQKWKLSAYELALTKISEAENRVEKMEAPDHWKFRCNETSATEKFLDKNGFSNIRYKSHFILFLHQESFTVAENCTLTDPEEILKFNQAIDKFLQFSSSYLLAKHKYNLASLSSKSDSLISCDQVNEILTYCAQRQKLSPEQKDYLLEQLQYEKYLHPELFKEFKEFLYNTPFSLEHNSSLEELDKKVLAEIIFLYLKQQEVDVTVTPEDVENGKNFAEFLIGKLVCSYTCAPIRSEARALQLIRNYGNRSLPKHLETDLARMLIQTQFAPTHYAHVTEGAEKNLFKALIEELVRLKKEERKAHEETELRTAQLSEELIPEPIRTVASGIWSALTAPAASAPLSPITQTPPSSYRMWA